MQTRKEQKPQRRNLTPAQVQTLKDLISLDRTNHDSLFPHRLECDYVTMKLLDMSKEFGDFDYLCDLISYMLLNLAKILASSSSEENMSNMEHYQFLLAIQMMFKNFHYLEINEN